MPVCERDPWRLQYFENVPCPDDVLIPTDDPDSWNWYPEFRWVYDKLRVAGSQGLPCGPHGVVPPSFPVFSKPMMNLKGMGIGSRTIASPQEFDRCYQPGHMWMELLQGPHISTDCAVLNGHVVWQRHATGKPGIAGTFEYWIVHAPGDAALEEYLTGWVERHMAGYTGMMNFETIGGKIIEAHLRFADQWCDLYGTGWVAALVKLYEKGVWEFDDSWRTEGYSLPLFASHGGWLRHPALELQERVRRFPHVTSLQITFHEKKTPEEHAMPPGGFRLGIVNATDLMAGFAARRLLATGFPADRLNLSD